MERTVFERHMDQGNITVVPAEQAIAAEKSEPVAETSAAAYTETPYKVGDTVYLDDTLFEITEVGDYNVQLRDPALAYPIFRAESNSGQAIRAIYAALDPVWQIGRDDSAADNETCSRPPTDLRGNPAVCASPSDSGIVEL